MFAFVEVLRGYTQDQYDAVAACLGEGPFPGLLAHLAGPCEGGWRIIEVWRSAEDQANHERGPLARALRESNAYAMGRAPVVERIEISRLLTVEARLSSSGG